MFSSVYKNTLIVGICLLFFSFTAAAETTPIKEIASCQAKHKKDLKSYIRCLDAADNQFARDMTSWENSIIYKLEEASESNGRGEALAGFKKSIRQFQVFKKVNCQWHYMAFLPDVTLATSKLKECEVDMSYDRIQKLMQLSEKEFY